MLFEQVWTHHHNKQSPTDYILQQQGSRCAQCNNFILMKIRFIDMEDFDNYILKNSNANLIILTLIKGFNHLLKSIQLLIDVNVVQFDLKGPNIVFDNKKNLPIIIDFGLSLPMNSLDTETMYNYFYIYAPEYYVWPLEVHYINLLLHITPEPDVNQLKDLAKRFTKSNAALEALKHYGVNINTVNITSNY